jgi:serine/threonine protein kinase
LKRFRFPHVEGSEELDQDEPPPSALREISILTSLKHHNIVNILDIAVDDKEPRDVYMVMEYCEQVGPSL